MKHISEIIEEYMKELNNKMKTEDDRLYNSVNNYTKYKLVEMLIEKYKDKNLDNLNAIEQLSDDVLKVLSIAGLKYYSELKHNFGKDDK
tara:strand:- start:4318 stop:4584 length:267 start_codon:yes stop_codon:yes gene_type:complete